MIKRGTQSEREAQRDADWKDTLARIRAGLPINNDYAIPKVIGETHKATKDRERDLLMNLCARQEWKCFWCGEPMTDGPAVANPRYRTLEHVVAKATGLRLINHLSNLRASCKECNNLRGQMQSVKVIVSQLNQVKSLFDGAHKTIARHRVTMSGRCIYCKLRFHVKEWFYRRQMTRKQLEDK